LYSRLLQVPVEDRSRQIGDLSGGDSQIESELRCLLRAHDQGSSFLGEPALDVLNISGEAPPEIETGAVLANRYTVLRFLKRGGMGAVYEAWDSELKEAVALKLIRPDIGALPEVIERFKQEVKQGRRVTHPNICRVYDLSSHGEPDGKKLWFLTMQLLPGKTLLETIQESGPIPRKKAMVLIEQMVAGLEAAHEQGIVHRDFKSANVMLVPETGGSERAVITDFGLAASVADAQADRSIHAGQGTRAYAPPEQWTRGEVSPTADQYSLGVVICEMLTGVRPAPPLQRPDQTWSRAMVPSHANVNRRLHAVVQRCIEGDPGKRFKSLPAVSRALGIGRQRMVLRMLSIPAAMLVIAIGVRIASTRQVKYSLKDLHLLEGATTATSPSFSSDGSVLAYEADSPGKQGSDIYVLTPGDGKTVRVTEDGLNNDPSISPDGRRIAYISGRNPSGIYWMNADGTGDTFFEPEGRNPRFSPDGSSILYWKGKVDETVASARIFVRRLDERNATLLAPDFADARYPIWSSDGRHILFKGCKSKTESKTESNTETKTEDLPACWDWWVTTSDGMAPVATGARAKLDSRKLTVRGEVGGWWGDTLLFSATAGEAIHLWALALPPSDTPHAGEIEPVDTGNEQERVFSSSLADTGAIAIPNLISAVHVWRIDPKSPNSSKGLEELTHGANLYITPSASANGQWLTFVRRTESSWTVCVMNMLAKKEIPLVSSSQPQRSPVVDDTGSKVAFESWEGNHPSVFLSVGGGTAKAICSECRVSAGWFNGTDGLFLGDSAMSKISLYNLKTGTLTPVLSAKKRFASQATWSQENQMLLFTASEDNSHYQVYAVRFPKDTAQASGDWIEITEPSTNAILPRWSDNGGRIYYLTDQNNAMCVWGRKFDQVSGKPYGAPFEARDFQGKKFSVEAIGRESLNMSVAQGQIYVNIAEISSSVSIGHLERKGRLAQIFTSFQGVEMVSR
jgi:serine/threonine protein kinase